MSGGPGESRESAMETQRETHTKILRTVPSGHCIQRRPLVFLPAFRRLTSCFALYLSLVMAVIAACMAESFSAATEALISLL